MSEEIRIPTDMDISIAVATWKIRHKKNLDQLAELLGVTRATIYRWIERPGDIKVSKLRMLCEMLEK